MLRDRSFPPGSYSPANHVAAATDTEFARNARIVRPQQRARARVIGLDHAPRGRDIQNAVDHQRGGFLATVDIDVGIPGQTELFHIVGLDPGQWTEALLAVGPAVSQPVGGIAVGLDNTIL